MPHLLHAPCLCCVPQCSCCTRIDTWRPVKPRSPHFGLRQCQAVLPDSRCRFLLAFEAVAPPHLCVQNLHIDSRLVKVIVGPRLADRFRALYAAIGKAFGPRSDIPALEMRLRKALQEGHQVPGPYASITRDIAKSLALEERMVVVTLSILMKELATRWSERKAFMREVMGPRNAEVPCEARWWRGVLQAVRARRTSYAHARWREVLPAHERKVLESLHEGLAALRHRGVSPWPVLQQVLSDERRQIREDTSESWRHIQMQFHHGRDTIVALHQTPLERERSLFKALGPDTGAAEEVEEFELEGDSDSGEATEPDSTEE